MAKLRELVTTMAETLGEPERTMNVRAMQLRKHGLIHSTGRGLNAAEMAPADAANLLIASMSGGLVTQAAETARIVLSGEQQTFESAGKLVPPEILGLEGLPATLGEAMEAVIGHTFAGYSRAQRARASHAISFSILRDVMCWSARFEWRTTKVFWNLNYRAWNPKFIKLLRVFSPEETLAAELFRDSESNTHNKQIIESVPAETFRRIALCLARSGKG